MGFIQATFKMFDILFSLPEKIIEPIGFIPEFIKDALIDSLNLLPFLFLIFVLIEVLEIYFNKKKHLFVFFMKKIGPMFGSVFASIPQCGFSVIASTLYTKRILSRGTLLSVYLATSDEAIPVLLAEPKMIAFVLPIIVIKIIFAIFIGYIVDSIFTYKANDPKPEKELVVHKKDCCHNHSNKKKIFVSSLLHTLNIFIFILLVSIGLGYLLSISGTKENLANLFLINTPLQPILVSLVGLIPNCAISVMLTMLFINHTISFGALIAGLSSAGGLGLLVLLTKNNDKKDTVIIIILNLVVSSLFGLAIQYNLFNINYLFKLWGIEI